MISVFTSCKSAISQKIVQQRTSTLDNFTFVLKILRWAASHGGMLLKLTSRAHASREAIN